MSERADLSTRSFADLKALVLTLLARVPALDSASASGFVRNRCPASSDSADLGAIRVGAAHEHRGLPPGAPVCTTVSWDTSCGISGERHSCLAAISSAVMTVTLLPT